MRRFLTRGLCRLAIVAALAVFATAVMADDESPGYRTEKPQLRRPGPARRGPGDRGERQPGPMMAPRGRGGPPWMHQHQGRPGGRGPGPMMGPRGRGGGERPGRGPDRRPPWRG